jgi:hypothetical protein
MSDPFFGQLEPAARSLVYAEAHRLLRRALGESHYLLRLLVDELDQQCGPEAQGGAAHGDGPERDGLLSLHARLAARGQIMTAQVAAAIAAQPRPLPDGRIPQDCADLLGGWAVAAMLRRLDLAEDENTDVREDENCVRQGADAFRLLKTKDPVTDLELINLAGVSSFEAAVERLESIRNDFSSRPPSSMFDQRLEKLLALFRAAATERGDLARTAGRQWREQPVTAPDGDDEDPGLTEYRDVEGEAPGPDAGDWEQREQERLADEQRDEFYISRSASTVDDREQANARTTTAVAVAATRALALPAEADVLTAHEARVLVDAARANPDNPALQSLALALVFGRRVDRLKRAFGLPRETELPPERWTIHRKRLVFDLTVILPDLTERDSVFEDPERVKGGRERVRLSPPDWLDPEALHEVDKADLDSAMTGLRKQVARPVSEGRIAGWLQASLQRAGADAALIGALCGIAPGERAQMHYTVLSADDVRGAWERALVGLCIAPPPRIEADAFIGSSVRPERSAFRKAVATLAARAATLGPDAPLSDLVAAHDAFTSYTLELLFLATGHRPVSAPFGQYADHDLETGVMWVSDKATRGGPSTRLVALSPFAKDQLGFWVEHLEALAARLERLGSRVHQTRIRPIFSPSRGGAPLPLFFFLAEDGRVVEVTETEIRDRRAGVLPKPVNAARHMLRTHLAASRMPTHAIDAFFGHGRLGEEPLTSDSALRFGDLQNIAMAAQNLLEDLGFTPLRSPLCPPR